ncbi:MAG: hypothetical protein RLZZ126_1892 [Pseudomonadota bacterium]|jgi:hypothetical protein
MRVAFFLLVVLISAHVSAQTPRTYRCPIGDSYRLQQTPCEPGVSTRIVSEGPVEPAPPTHQQRFQSYPAQGMRAPQEHAKYLRGECASMYEGIRTAHARGVASSLPALQSDYQRCCADEDAEAHRQYSRERSDKYQEKREQRKAEIVASSAEKRHTDGCVALGDTIAIRRKREPQMNDAERAAFKQSEAAFLQRCR